MKRRGWVTIRHRKEKSRGGGGEDVEEQGVIVRVTEWVWCLERGRERSLCKKTRGEGKGVRKIKEEGCAWVSVDGVGDSVGLVVPSADA